MREELVQVQTTLATAGAAAELAQMILDARLAACVQQYPIQSMYHWEGKQENTAEIALTAKTRATLAAQLVDLIKQHHPYAVPEILVLPVLASHPAYRQWVCAETGSAP